jgi:hypothetical protein
MEFHKIDSGWIRVLLKIGILASKLSSRKIFFKKVSTIQYSNFYSETFPSMYFDVFNSYLPVQVIDVNLFGT